MFVNARALMFRGFYDGIIIHLVHYPFDMI